MAAEEKKFNNTVLLTSGRESVMLGGRGTKRERKIPQRYQNSSLLLDKEEKEFSHKEIKVAQYSSGVFNFCQRILSISLFCHFYGGGKVIIFFSILGG